jgi:phosphate binding protein
MVHPSNDFATCMTVDEIHQVFATDGATRWNEVRADWPDESIVKYYPGTDSGTFDYFVEAIIEGVADDATHTGDGTASEDDNILAQGIENDDYAIGYFGFAYFLEAGDALSAVAVDGGDGCVEPSFDAALDGSYQPLARPIFIYTRESFLAERPEILGFVNFYLDNLEVLVPEVGYVTMPADLKAQQVAKIAMHLDGETAAAATEEPMDGIDYSSLGGEIRIDGSSTVFPISEAVAEEFSLVSNTRVNVAFSGTGGGFEKFCRGETQISDASRPIKDDEVQACANAGIDDVVELQVAIDALTVMVHPSNDFATCMTVEELHQVFATGGATRWNEVRADWPDESIVKYYPGTDSGTFDYFVEAIIEGVADDATHTGDGTASEDDNILAQGIENDDYAIGYFGFAYFLEAGDALSAVAVDGGEGCVEPSFDAALDGSYQPLARPIFIYTRESFLAERPEILGFVNFYLDNLEVLVPEVGYVTMPADLKAQQVAKIEPFLGG